MLIPLSWLKDYVSVPDDLEELARTLTMLGLEVDAVHLVGLSAPQGKRLEFKYDGLGWAPDKIVVASISEVMPHPNADRLVLCRLFDGQQDRIVLTGAPNLYPYKGQGKLAHEIKVAYAKEGSVLYDGHQPGQVLTTLKRTKIRGVESDSMVCSEKELGISEEHEGIIFLPEDAPAGMPLAEYMGDAVIEISILPNMIRNASIVGVARELAAATGQKVKLPQTNALEAGEPISGKVSIEISNPQLNPRFVLGLIEGVKIQPSPAKVQSRLKLAGMRPINNIVDATNYVMLEFGQPLHAFDFDVLCKRAGSAAPVIITRTAAQGEKLTTLDGVERTLDASTVLVCDRVGSLSIAGVMGGQESEVSENTTRVLLEGAAWNYINIRKTAMAQKLPSEASYRFSRGVHPALTVVGVRRGLECMAAWSGGVIDKGLVDNYPLPAATPEITLSAGDVERGLGIRLAPDEIADLLRRLDFTCKVSQDVLTVQPPDYRLDIGSGVSGKADVLEEIARLYGYDRIPGTRMSDGLPPLRRNFQLDTEERIRDLLANLGLQEVVSYRMTSPEREARLTPDNKPLTSGEYLRLINPITPERNVLRRSLLACVLDAIERNDRLSERLAFFEIGPVFIPRPEEDLPDEALRLALVIRGARSLPAWDGASAQGNLDFFDLKGIITALIESLHLPEVEIAASDDARFHPGMCAAVISAGRELGVFGQLHPQVKAHYDLGPAPVLAADFDLRALLSAVPEQWPLEAVPVFPPVLEDIAIIVSEETTAGQVEAVIRQAGGKLLAEARLFDIFRGEQIGAGQKSMAYSLKYMAPDRTLTDKEAAQIRQRVVRKLEQDLGAKLRSA